MPHKESKAAQWVYTWNKPNVGPDEHHASLAEVAPSFHVFQLEDTDNNPHYQGYVEFKSAKSLRQLKLCNPQAHWESRRGTQAQAIAYCEKEDTRVEGPWRFGEPKPARRAGMSDDFVKEVASGKRLRDLLATHAEDVRKYPRFYEVLRRVYPPPQRDTPPDVVLHIGPPGAGKTRSVREAHDAEDLFIKPVDRGFWMDGYDGQPVVLLDDFAGSANHVTLVNLLQMIDRYLTQVPVKGSFVWWQPEAIHITTNIHPANWYDWKDRME